MFRAPLMNHNAAKTGAAALLRRDSPALYPTPEGPFAARQAGEFGKRRRPNALHRSILVRRVIGAIRINRTTASVVTQETWSNLDAGAVAAEPVTVRVTYKLRWDAGAVRTFMRKYWLSGIVSYPSAHSRYRELRLSCPTPPRNTG